jgi:TetR/AcrR family transcriptional repressor of nem operon
MVGVRQFDEGEALEKALSLFWKKGFAGTSMQELAAVTGVQRGSLYNAYQGKEAFFLRVFDVYTEQFLSQMRKSLNKPKLRDALRSFFDFVINSLTTGEPTRGCLTTKSAFGADILEEPVREALQTMLDTIETLVFDRLSLPEKGIHLAISPQDAARLIVSFVQGLVVLERVYQDRTRLRSTADSLTTLLLGASTTDRPHAA